MSLAVHFVCQSIPLQVLVDISTQADAFQKVDAAVTEHFKANPKEYTGEKLVVANNATDPLKFTLCVFWEYGHPGKAEISFNSWGMSKFGSSSQPTSNMSTEAALYMRKGSQLLNRIYAACSWYVPSVTEDVNFGSINWPA